MLAASFVLVPLVLYVVAFSVETVAAFTRLHNYGSYVSATWEITHTLLVLALTNFTWLFSSAIPVVAPAVYWGLIITAAAFVVREILYVYLFYASRPGTHSAASWTFAFMHVVMLAGLIFVVFKAWEVMRGYNYTVNDHLIPYMWPALVTVLAISAIPIWQSYRIIHSHNR